MSDHSYFENLNRGVTGPATLTCRIAAHDRVSPEKLASSATYSKYDEALHRLMYERETGILEPSVVVRHLVKQAVGDCYRELGVANSGDVWRGTATSEERLRMILGTLSVNGYRTALTIDSLGPTGFHAVGVESAGGDFYELKSTSSPFKAGEPVPVSRIFPMLSQSFCDIANGAAYNIEALPPEPD